MEIKYKVEGNWITRLGKLKEKLEIEIDNKIKDKILLEWLSCWLVGLLDCWSELETMFKVYKYKDNKLVVN